MLLRIEVHPEFLLGGEFLGIADPALYSVLRTAHSALAFLLFATFIAHFSGAMMLIIRDGVFESMASWKKRMRENPATRLV